MPISPGDRDSSQVPPTSGKKPSQADAAAHHDAIHQGHIGLAERRNARVENVLLAPQDLAEITAGPRAVIQRTDVAAGAEAAVTRTFQQDQGDRRVGLKRVERLVDLAKHLKRHRIDRFRPIEPDGSGGALAPCDQVGFNAGNGRSGSRHRAPSISLRETISRMISLVPSRIWCTRRSRTIFSMPYSLR